MIQGYLRWERRFMAALQRHCRRDWLDGPVCALTHLGDLGLIWVLWGVALFAYDRGKCVLLLGSVALCAIVCNLLMKPLFARRRPFELDGVETKLLIREPEDHSFPSGHTMASFTAATVLCFLYGGWVWAFALCLALLIAFSRLYLFVHHLSDVLAGMLFGSLLGLLCSRFGWELAQAVGQWSYQIV